MRKKAAQLAANTAERISLAPVRQQKLAGGVIAGSSVNPLFEAI
jgi:hypothetical protein